MEQTQIYKTRKLVNELNSYLGFGTSMISLILPPNEDLNKIS